MPKQSKTELEYVSKIKMYNIVTEQIKELKTKQDEIKEEVAKLLHKDKINEKIIDVDGVKFKAGYQHRTNKKVDHKALIEMIGVSQYGEVVSENSSSFIQIKKAPKSQQDNILHQAPVKEDKKNLPPIGSLA